VIVPKNSNNILLSLEYVLDIKSTFNNSYFKNYNSFFEEYLKVSYKSDKVYKMVDSTIIKSEVDNRVFISVPYNLINSSEIKISFNFRDVSYYYVFE